MGEEKKMEEKKTEEKKPGGDEKKEEKSEKSEKVVEEKKEEKKTEDLKDGKELKEQTGGAGNAAPAPAPAPAPPVEIVLKVYMHCEGCARKVRRSLKGFEGVEDVITDCRTHKAIVKGEKADPLKVLERVQRKSHRQVELLSPIPKPASEDKKVAEVEKPKPEEKKEEAQVITVVFKIHMHCEACAQEIKKRIQRMKGVESAEPDLKSSQVTVKGVFDPESLVEYLYKRTGKQAVIVKQEPQKKEEEKGKDGKDEKKGEDGNEKEKKDGEKETKEKKEDENEAKTENSAEETKVVELNRNEYYYYPPRYGMELYAYPPQIFSDENPNACSVM